MIPFEEEDATSIARWLDRSTAPTVRAVRVECHDEDDWLAARINGIGASEVGIITGVSTWTSPYALWWRKKLDWRLPRTEVQRWGHLVEDPIAALFAEEMADSAYVAKPLGAPYSLWCHPVSQWMLCTPDRLAVHKNGEVCPVEIKSDEGGKGWGEPGTDEVPEHHRAQSMWQAYIFGAAGGWVVRKRGSGKGRLHIYWVPLVERYLLDMKAAAGDFLASVALGDAPDPDGAKSTTETLKELNPAIDEGVFADIPEWLFREWAHARRDKREATAREALASNRLRASMGRAEYATYRTTDGLDVIFAKRRMGKRQGYAVAPGTTDELREIGSSEERTEAPGVRPPKDVQAGPPASEEGAGDGDSPGAGLGDAEGTGAGDTPPGGAEIADLEAWAAEHSHPGQTCEEFEQTWKGQVTCTATNCPTGPFGHPFAGSCIVAVELPHELAELVDRALNGGPSERVHRKRPRYKPNPHTTAPLADDSGAYMEPTEEN